ncbi:MAG: NAD(P)-binding protein [Chloroflexi bacterium]|nr:NAD(P)-binding protein [Chloroflexota bacterium]
MSDKRREEKETIGAALVVGGGVAGVQAALDLAEAGIKVYLVEQSAAIGGKMAQLDKTFPTNDCAMCTISPRLVECGRHLNIELLTNSVVESISGAAADFTVTVRQKPRFVSLERCTSCDDCVKVCPVTVPNQFNATLDQRTAIYKLYPQAVPNAYAIEKKGIAPCKAACPAGISVQGYIALIVQGRFIDALRVVKDRMPFAAACGRICNHPCEKECNRGVVDEAVSIMYLKRFVSDYAFNTGAPLPEPVEKTKSERVAIIGAGPAGLTAAKDLAHLGYPVTAFEALPVAGGMLRVGIPEYRLPRHLLQRDIDEICALGVDLQLNMALGRDITIQQLFREGYQAIFLALGAHVSQKLNVEGEDAIGVLGAIDFLREVSLGTVQHTGERVAVIGGGNTAIDAARTAVRLGAKEVRLVYRRSLEEMPADRPEIEEAEAEGVSLLLQTAPVGILSDEQGKVTALVCQKMALGEPDESGRRRPIPIPGSEFTLEVDTVIAAVNQTVDTTSLPEKIVVTAKGTITVDPETLSTTMPGVFAGGDAVSGTAYVVDAVAAGHRAALSIDRFLRGEIASSPVPESLPVVELGKAEAQQKLLNKEIIRQSCPPMPTLPLVQRRGNFDEVELGFTEEMAIAEARRCLNCGICSECYECVRVCQAKAIDHGERERQKQLRVGAVILAPGYEVYEARLAEEFGFGRYLNVVTSLQFERLLSASGPTAGEVIRPSDHVPAKRIAFLQCIGSRDKEHPYCSSVCCMYATKEAIMAKEHSPDTDCHIFLMDMRAFGKGFDAYYERARNVYGIKYTRCRPSSLKESPHTKNIILRYEANDGCLVEEEFDLVVLSVGMAPPPGARALAETFGIELNPYGFCRTDKLAPLRTSQAGVFVCGPFTAPMDIPDSVTQASAAAAEALRLLATARGALVSEKVYPAEIPLADQEPRVGVFICHCGSNIAGVVDVEEVRQYAETLGKVVHTERNLYTCAPDAQERIRQQIAEHRLNRVVVASCTPRTHEPLFQETIREAGLNPYLFEMANIRDQCSWVHSDDHRRATEKAKELVRMAVARARLLEPLTKMPQAISHRALVIGGGISGMTAALSLADQGFGVYLVEQEFELGGNLRHLYNTIDGYDPQTHLRSLIQRVIGHERIEVLLDTEVVKSTGFVGNFKTTIEQDGRQHLLEHGATIVATGGREYRGDEYLLGKDKRVITQLDLEEKMADLSPEVTAAKTVAMIQCVGPAGERAGYCSRLCCVSAMKNALRLKELNPAATIYVLYKDIRTYAFYEELYTQARSKGVIFLRYDEGQEPQVHLTNGHLECLIADKILDEELTIEPDLLVLSTAVVPNEGGEKLAPILKLPLTKEGFFLEAHIKLRPVDFASDGIFVCGLAHYPKPIEECISQALATAARAATILSKIQLEVGGPVAKVEAEKCAACLTCVRVCPYGVPIINAEGVAEIEAAACHGCGICVAECPAKAIQLAHFRDDQIMVKSEALLVGEK